MVIDVPENNEESGQNHGAAPSALPRMIRIAVPIGSVLVLIAFAVTALLPSNPDAVPTQSTVLFIPIYLTIVIVMYIFKSFVEKDVPSAGY
jgi:hypothetical protein